MTKFTYRLTTSILLGVATLPHALSQQQNAADDLLKQSRALIEQRDFDKAKLSLNLYQKYVEKLPLNWLYAQSELIKIAIEENKTAIAKNLFVEAEKLISNNKLEKTRESQRINILKSQFYSLQNDFEKSNRLLNSLIDKFDDAEAETLLINNLLDEALVNTILFKQEAKFEELNESIQKYEASLLKNPIEVIRLKNKLALIKKPTKVNSDEFNKLSELWIQKDEFALLKIYLNTDLGNEVKALSIWQENKDILSIKTHPASVAVLSLLADKVQHFNAPKTEELLKFCQLLIRNANDLAQITETEVEVMINTDRIGEAVSTIDEFLKNNSKAHNAGFLKASVCIALIEANDLKTCQTIFEQIAKDRIKNSELKSKVNFIEASLLQNSAKEKEAAALFLRVGQTSKDRQLIISSLYQAGLSFENSKQFKSATIAFKQLLEQRRHKLTDSAFLRLYKVQAADKDFKEALKTIQTIIENSLNPSLKEQALYDKGQILMLNGDTENAIKAFYDYALVYPKDSRSAQMLFEVYKIQKSSLKDLAKAAVTLDNIIAKSKDISPDIYSRSLHHRALLFQLAGKPRESITLWETYLEFTRKLQHPLTDEVKLQLAAAYQNSNEYNQSAAASVYADIVTTSKNRQYMEVAIANLASLEKNNEALKEAIIDLLNHKKHLSDDILTIIFNWMHKTDHKKDSEALKRLHKQLGIILSAQKGTDGFWDAQLFFFEGILTKDKGIASKALKKSLEKLTKSKKDYISVTKLKIKVYAKLSDKHLELSEYLNLIYYFQEHLSNDNYADWQFFYDAGLEAAKILKSKNKIGKIISLRQRLLDSQLPQSEKVIQAIDDMLKVEVERVKK